MRATDVRPSCFEFFNSLCLQNVETHLGIKSPFSQPTPFYALMEFEDAPEDATQTQKFLENAVSQEWLTDVLTAASSEQRKSFWRFREEITESLSPKKPYKNDVSVPLKALTGFVDVLTKFLSENCPFEVCLFGHLGDGNVHINILKPHDLDNALFVREAQELDENIYALVFAHEGSISAEHGIGLGKKAGVGRQFRAGELDILRKIKSILDPEGVLNPGKIFDN
jgi:FAD/FMN-containing dehydrogenase